MLHVRDVEWRGDYLLHIVFDNGVAKVVDVAPLLTGPVFESLHDIDQFRTVKVDPVAKTIVWANGADLAPEALLALDPVDSAPRP